MMDAIVTKPIAGLDAFRSDAPAANWSKSAQLLVIAKRLAAIAPSAKVAPQAQTRTQTQAQTRAQMQAETDEAAIGAPQVHPVVGQRVSPRAVPPSASAPELWRSLDSDGDPSTALALLRHQLDSPTQIVRVTAASSLLALGVETEIASERLTDITRFTSQTARALAACALRIPGAPIPKVSDTSLSRVSIGIAGTFGRWRSPQLTPGGALFALLKQNLSPDLYSDTASYYRWTGAFSEQARQGAASDLLRWLATSASGAFLNDVYAHSHGGNVALDAIVAGTSMDFLLLIDTPALQRPSAEWSTINSRLGRAVSLRSRLDLVILLDQLLGGGPGSRGSDGLTFSPDFDCRVLSPPVWFSHQAMLQPSVWAKFDLLEQIRYEMSLA